MVSVYRGDNSYYKTRTQAKRRKGSVELNGKAIFSFALCIAAIIMLFTFVLSSFATVRRDALDIQRIEKENAALESSIQVAAYQLEHSCSLEHIGTRAEQELGMHFE